MCVFVFTAFLECDFVYRFARFSLFKTGTQNIHTLNSSKGIFVNLLKLRMKEKVYGIPEQVLIVLHVDEAEFVPTSLISRPSRASEAFVRDACRDPLSGGELW